MKVPGGRVLGGVSWGVWRWGSQTTGVLGRQGMGFLRVKNLGRWGSHVSAPKKARRRSPRKGGFLGSWGSRGVSVSFSLLSVSLPLALAFWVCLLAVRLSACSPRGPGGAAERGSLGFPWANRGLQGAHGASVAGLLQPPACCCWLARCHPGWPSAARLPRSWRERRGPEPPSPGRPGPSCHPCKLSSTLDVSPGQRQGGIRRCWIWKGRKPLGSSSPAPGQALHTRLSFPYQAGVPGVPQLPRGSLGTRPSLQREGWGVASPRGLAGRKTEAAGPQASPGEANPAPR